jgi:hypothetical protein
MVDTAHCAVYYAALATLQPIRFPTIGLSICLALTSWVSILGVVLFAS